MNRDQKYLGRCITLMSFNILLFSASFSCQPALALMEETPEKAISAPPTSASTEDAGDPTSKLEKRLFDFAYNSDSEDTRLKRLENFVFGAPQTGSDSQRLARLEKSVTEGQTPPVKPSSEAATNKSPATGNQESQPSTNDDSAPFNYTDYPRVDQLEQEMLGAQHHDESLPTRLSRLETKAFGHPSTSNDLASRVDALDNYVNRNDIYGERNTLTPTSNYAPTTAPPAPNPYLQPNVVSTNDRVTAMEKAVFGHDYTNRSLNDRVTRLEKKIIPYKHGQESQSLTARVDQLWSILSVANTLKSSPYAANPQNANFSQSSYGYSNTQIGNGERTQNVTQKPHHSWLHKVGHVLGTAAMVAAESGMMGMGGMGGMGYYPGMGYGGYNGIGGF